MRWMCVVILLIGGGLGGIGGCVEDDARAAQAVSTDKPPRPAGDPQFDHTPGTFDKRDMTVVLPETWQGVTTNVVFQVWSDTTGGVQAVMTDRSPPFVYPAKRLLEVSPGTGEVQAILRNADDKVLGSVRHKMKFPGGKGVVGPHFRELEKVYSREAGEGITLALPDEMRGVANVVFQVWSDVSGGIEAPHLDRAPPFVYPAAELLKVSLGPGEVQAILRDADDTVIRSVRKRIRFVERVEVVPEIDAESITAKFADKPSRVNLASPPIIEVRVYSNATEPKPIEGLNVVFQCWIDGVGVAGAHTVREGRFIYPDRVLATVPPGSGEVQALVRDGNDRVLKRLRFLTRFIGTPRPAEEPSGQPLPNPRRIDSNAEAYQRPADLPPPPIRGELSAP